MRHSLQRNRCSTTRTSPASSLWLRSVVLKVSPSGGAVGGRGVGRVGLPLAVGAAVPRVGVALRAVVDEELGGGDVGGGHELDLLGLVVAPRPRPPRVVRPATVEMALLHRRGRG